jgi:hypothetical protein
MLIGLRAFKGCFRYWWNFYEPHIRTLERLKRKFDAHIEALSAEHAVFLLTEEDENVLLRSLENPPPPNEALRAAVRRG